MNLETKFRFAEEWNLHKEELKDKKYYLFNVNKGDIIKLNEVSFNILVNINGENTIQEIIDIILKQFDVENDILIKDIEGLFNKCLEKNITAKIS